MSPCVLVVYPGDSGLPSLSPPAAKVALALRYVGAQHRVLEIMATQVKRYSPTGRVPALLIEGRKTLVDSVRLLDYLEEQPDLKSLAPRNPGQRAIDRAWEHFANESLYWVLVYARWCVPENLERAIDGITRGAGWPMRGLIKFFGARECRARCKGQGIGNKPYDEIVADFERGCALLQDALGRGPYLQNRETPGRGDLAVASLLAQVGWRQAAPRMGSVLDQHPALKAHAKRTFEASGYPAPDWL